MVWSEFLQSPLPKLREKWMGERVSLRAQQHLSGDSNNMTVVIIHLKKASFSFFLQAVGQKSWAGRGDWAGNGRDPDRVRCGFLWFFPQSPGMSSPEPALGYLTGRAGQKKRFKVMTKSVVWHSFLGWCRVVLFWFAFITLWKGTDFITRAILHITCASMERNCFWKYLQSQKISYLEKYFVRQRGFFSKELLKTENLVFGT